MRVWVFVVIVLLLPMILADRYIVEYEEGHKPIIQTHGDIVKEFKHTLNKVVIVATPEEIKALKKQKNVKSIRKDKRIHAITDDSIPLINADEVWKLNDSIGRNLTGLGITIAIIDTGINYSHPDLGGCTRQQFTSGNCAKVIEGYDFVNLDNNPMDDHSHGTHCAGIAAGNGTIKGVAPDAKLIAYKVLDSDGNGYESDLALAIDYAIDPNRDGNTSDHYDVISLSIGGLGDSDDLMSRAVDKAVSAGVVVSVAAGNSGPSGDDDCINGTDGSEYSICSPGTARMGITVGATTKTDDIAGYSGRGPLFTGGIKPDILAPGSNIYSTMPIGYGYKSGTSMATPHVAGAAALILQKHPDWSPSDIKMAFRNTALDVGYNPLTQGYGRFDVLEAVTLENRPPIAFINHSTMNYTEKFSIEGTASSDSFTNYTVWYGSGIDPSSWTLLHTSAQQISYGNLSAISTIPNGTQTIKLEVNDANGTTSIDKRLVEIIDTENPTISSGSKTIETGRSFSYDVNATDNFAISNFTINDSTFIIDKTGYISNSTPLDFKNYTMTVTCNDPSLNSNSGEILLMQLDTTNPKFTGIATTVIFKFDEGFNYDVNATDNSRSILFTIDNNNFTIGSTGIITNRTPLFPGIYLINITITDSSINENSSQMSLIAEEYEAPRFIEAENQDVEFGTRINYTLNITDNILIEEVYLNDTSFSIDQSFTITNNSVMEIGSTAINITANDSSKNQNSTYILIRVEDTTPPIISGPSVPTIYQNQDLAATYQASDLNLISTWRINDSYFRINGSGHLTNQTILQIRTYDLIINVNDSYGNTATYNITVNVTDMPDIISPRFHNLPQNRTTAYQSQFSFDVNVTDNCGSITLSLNDSAAFTVHALTISNNTILLLRDYTLSIIANDSAGNVNVSELTIEVADLKAPRLGTSEYQRPYGEPFLTHLDAKDDVQIDTTTTDHMNFTINASGWVTNTSKLRMGNHTINITINDTSGNANTTALNLAVFPNTSISLIAPANSSRITASSTVRFSFIVTGTDNITYCTLNINEDSIINISASLTQVNQISRTLSNRVYNWSIGCIDPYGIWESETYIYTLDYTAPTSSSSSSSGSSSGGGGGGSLYINQDQKTKSWYKVTAGDPVEWNLSHERMVYMKVTPSIDSYNARLTLRDVENISTAAEHAAYYINITSTFPVERAQLQFKLNKTATEGKDIILSRYTTRWVDLPTRLIKSDSDYNYYTATTPGFSLFAAKTLDKNPIKAVEEPIEAAIEENSTLGNEEEIPEVTTHTAEESEPVIEAPIPELKIPTFVIVITVALIILAIIPTAKRKIPKQVKK